MRGRVRPPSPRSERILWRCRDATAKKRQLVSPSPVKTTVPSGAETADPGSQVPSWALVLLWSASEPHRVGEVAFLPSFERRLVGRGDEELEKFAHFGKQRPGEPLAASSHVGIASAIRASNGDARSLAVTGFVPVVVEI